MSIFLERRSRPYSGKLHLLPCAEGMPFAGHSTEASILYTQQIEIAKRIFFKKDLCKEEDVVILRTSV
jgi:hypothetical protein